MLTFGAGRPFHARVDLPRSAEDLAEVVDVLRAPAVAHRVSRVVFVVYAQQPAPRRRARPTPWCAGFQRRRDRRPGRAPRGRHRWYPLLRPRPGLGPEGVAYDVGAHPFTAQAVLDGRVTLGSRAELAASLERPRAGRGAGRGPRPLPRRAGATTSGGPATWWRRCVTRAAEVPEDEEAGAAARRLVGRRVRAPPVRLMTRTAAPAHVGFWTDVVRRAPDDLLATPAALLGFAAWLAGHGALAWCAVDRCRRSAGPRAWPACWPGCSPRRCRPGVGGAGRGGRSGTIPRVGSTRWRPAPPRDLGCGHGRRGRGTGVLAGRPHPAPREGPPLPRRVRADAARGPLRHRRPDDRARGRAQPHRRARATRRSRTPRRSRRSRTRTSRPSSASSTSRSTCRPAKLREGGLTTFEDTLRAQPQRRRGAARPRSAPTW